MIANDTKCVAFLEFLQCMIRRGLGNGMNC